MFALARRNRVALPHADIASVKRAYAFTGLESFLRIYYRACSVLLCEQDFYELTSAYLARARTQGVRHAEMFFDPQTHTARGIDFGSVVRGISRAMNDAEPQGISSRLIMCFLRDQSADAAMATLEQALAYRHLICGVGLDSAEVGHPPRKFKDVYRRATAEGFRVVAHAGEEGPADYIWQALDVLGVQRVDHGVRCLEDAALVSRLAADRIALTVCPLSNLRLQVVDALSRHPLKEILERGLCATVNSDDPAYFGGYVSDNFAAVASALTLEDDALVHLARNSFNASFLDAATKARYLAEIDATAFGPPPAPPTRFTHEGPAPPT